MTDALKPPLHGAGSPATDFGAALSSFSVPASEDAASEEQLYLQVTRALASMGFRGAVMIRRGDTALLEVRQSTPHPVISRIEQLTGIRTNGHAIDASTVDAYREVLDTGRPCYVADSNDVLAQVLPPLARPFLALLRRAIGSTPSMYAPLRCDGRVLGIVNAAGPNLAEADLPAFAGFAAGVSLTLDNLRLQRARAEGSSGSALVSDLLLRALRGEPIERLCEAIVDEVTSAPGVARGAAVTKVGAADAQLIQRGLEPRELALLQQVGRERPGPAFLAGECDCPACQQLAELGAVVVPVVLQDVPWGLVVIAPARSDARPLLAALGVAVANALGVVLMARDAEAERKKAQDRFIHAQRLEAVGQLAGSVAHDFNNMLTAVVLTARLARERLPQASSTHADLLEIERCCERGTRLTRQLLMFSRRQAFAKVPVAVNELVTQMRELLVRLLGERVRLEVELPRDAWAVLGDVGVFEQVLLNLAVNARDAMPGGGVLRIGVTHHPACCPPRAPAVLDWVRVAVSDTGVGMDPATMGRIFEPFFTTKGPERGTGLGLAVVDSVVRDAHGWIDVESTPGRGTAFHVWLPRAPVAPGEQAAAGARTARARARARLLIVEDDELLRRFLVRYLERAGHDVRAEGSLADARRTLAGWQSGPDLLLSDVVLPDGNGLALAAEARAARPGLKALLMSGYLDDESHIHDIREGGLAFIAKPFTPDALLARIEESLAGAPPAASPAPG